jgi:hypothetical protein
MTPQFLVARLVTIVAGGGAAIRDAPAITNSSELRQPTLVIKNRFKVKKGESTDAAVADKPNCGLPRIDVLAINKEKR